MNRVERANWLARECLSGTIDDLGCDAQDMPVRGCPDQVRFSIRRLGFGEFTERSGAQKDAIAFDKGQVRGDDEVRVAEQSTNLGSRILVQKPGQHGAGFRVHAHREPRSSSRSRTALILPRRRRGSGSYRLASPGEPSVTRPRFASASRPAGTDASATVSPGGENSATTSPRSVTSRLSPERTSRRYSLSRFLSSRMPTVFTFRIVAS
jgi:hypothetical protein